MASPRRLRATTVSYTHLDVYKRQVFNSLAAGMSPDNAIAGPIVMVLIFLIGHSIKDVYKRQGDFRMGQPGVLKTRHLIISGANAGN